MNSAKRTSRLLDLNRRGIKPHDPNDNGMVSAEWRKAGGICLLRGRRQGEPKIPSNRKLWKRTYVKKSSPLSDAERSPKKTVSDPDVVIGSQDIVDSATSKIGTNNTPKESSILWGIPDLVRRAGSFLITLIVRREVKTKKPPLK